MVLFMLRSCWFKLRYLLQTCSWLQCRYVTVFTFKKIRFPGCTGVISIEDLNDILVRFLHAWTTYVYVGLEAPVYRVYMCLCIALTRAVWILDWAFGVTLLLYVQLDLCFLYFCIWKQQPCPSMLGAWKRMSAWLIYRAVLNAGDSCLHVLGLGNLIRRN